MIQTTKQTTSPMCCKIQTIKTNSSQSYSVQSLLNQTDEIDNSVLDLSIKEKRQRLNNEQSINSTENLPEIQNNEKMKQFLFNAIHQQRELQTQTNRKLKNENFDFLQTTKSNLDSLQKFCNPTRNLPWNFIRSPTTNINESGANNNNNSMNSNNNSNNNNNNINNNNNNMLNQFQKFIYNKSLINPLYSRRHLKNLFTPTPPTDSITNYFNNLSQLFSTRLNSNQQTETTTHMPVLSENFTKHYSNSNIDINNHFSLQNILKSTSNRKRKRTKVTDTRLPRRNTSQSLNNFPSINETNLSETTRFSTYLNPPSNSSQSSHSDETPGDPKRYTLTPIHLRKAKLMFLYTRYPNSQMLKSYFPDITFYKQNTAQLVKWFSNFREFYYSEMEKAVQRAVSNGIQHAKDIDVTVDSELFKNLMTHFNKKKQIVVPCEFLTTVQITLREFFDAISAGKNLHQSWKKPIYKTIAKLDQMLPEFFKDMNWMMELAKDENDSLNS